nr:hypothetical protein [Tanacetum cinerariifolium]
VACENNDEFLGFTHNYKPPLDHKSDEDDNSSDSDDERFDDSVLHLMETTTTLSNLDVTPPNDVCDAPVVKPIFVELLKELKYEQLDMKMIDPITNVDKEELMLLIDSPQWRPCRKRLKSSTSSTKSGKVMSRSQDSPRSSQKGVTYFHTLKQKELLK